MGSEPAIHPPSPVLVSAASGQTVPAHRAVTVGVKLASATIALMVVATAIVYWQLSSYQREHLLQAKQMAALAVTRLFADSCAAPIVFEDNGSIDEALHRLGKSGDIPYAAVWTADAAGRGARRGRQGSADTRQ